MPRRAGKYEVSTEMHQAAARLTIVSRGPERYIKEYLVPSCIMVLILVCAVVSAAEDRYIVISDQLAGAAERQRVDMGTFGRRLKINFGEYTIRDSKNGVIKSRHKSNLLGTKSSSISEYSFVFTLGHSTPELASVSAMTNVTTEELHSLATSVGAHLSVAFGTDAFLQQSTFSAVISVTGDDEDVWVLRVRSQDEVESLSQTSRAEEIILTNGARTIRVVSTNSNGLGSEPQSQPATGVEFLEDDRSLGAVQFHGGGFLGGMNKKFVWIEAALDRRMKLILAAASAALLQFEMTKPFLGLPDAG